MKKVIVALFLMVGPSLTLLAQTQAPRADVRETAERTRIREGRKDGEITKGEAATLHAEQHRIKRSERRAKADGQVTPHEKARLERKQDRASRQIRKEKHDSNVQ